MSLKSIRKSYSKFILALESAGIKLNESQKSDLDAFILAIESKMRSQKEIAIKTTKKLVTEHLEKQYKKVFESILKHQQENVELSSKIQSKVTSIKESKKIARKVSDYLDLYVESILPKKTIIDYDRMQKLEKLHESLKDLLVVDEDAVKAKQQQLAESFNKDKKNLETQIAKLQVKLNESMSKTLALNKKIDQFKALELLESKTKDLPEFEARQIKKRLANASTVEIEKRFNTILESVKEDMKVEEKEEITTIEEEVKDIIENEDDVQENDILKNKAHNAHITEDENEDVVESEETEETNESDDVELAESEIIDSELMKLWCQQARRFY